MDARSSRLITARADQMFPQFDAEEMERLAKFGEPLSYRAGDMVVRVGEPGPGVLLVRSGCIEVVGSQAGERRPIVTHRAGHFLGELAQLSGRPSLIDAQALTDVDAIAIPADRLRTLFVGEAELGERVMRAMILRRMELIDNGSGPVIIGDQADGAVLKLADFLRRNAHPFRQIDPDKDPCAQALIERFGVGRADMPIVLCPDGQLLRSPSEVELARCVGLVRPPADIRCYDLIVVGAGPAGLAASVYAASEGLSVITVDCRAFGGQAGASARIENYLGFPTGISGVALMARAYHQAQKFGAEMAIPDEATILQTEDGSHFIRLENGESLSGRVIVIATGARYRKIPVSRLAEFEGTSVHYWASSMEAELAAGEEIVLVGGGNSAGQAAVYLASRARRVNIVARRPLERTMSQYLVERLHGMDNVAISPNCELSEIKGQNGALEEVCWRARDTGTETRCPARHLFSFIGAEPNTVWLAGSAIKLDRGGFVLTGADAASGASQFQTSVRGIFAIGDVRANSVKRVASAVGDGAQVVAAVHRYLRRSS